jgi:hypothetical protein
MKRITRLTEADLTRIVRKVINEDSSKAGLLYSEINNLIDGSYPEMDPSDVANVLRIILDVYESMSYRKKRGIDSVSKDDVIKRFRQ